MKLVKKSKYLQQFIRFCLGKLGVFPKVNSKLRLIKNADLSHDFKQTLRQMAFSRPRKVEPFLKSYLSNDIRLIKRARFTDCEGGAILLCAVKDDFARIKMQINHHRNIGVKHFIYIDNISTDGTFEWLKEQEDVTLYTVDALYNSTIRMGWCQSAIEQEGYGKWYLILDSDELFAYPHMENANILKYVSFLENKKISAVTTPMIDMYSQSEIFMANPDEEIKNAHCFFDTFYYQDHRYVNWHFGGGPRYRLFSLKNELTKHSLIKVGKDMVIDVHEIFPFHKNTETRAVAFLLHYKFLPGDAQKYKEIVKAGNYSWGSQEYKAYMRHYEQNPKVSFYYPGSQKLNTSIDLLKINIADKKFSNEFINWTQGSTHLS